MIPSLILKLWERLNNNRYIAEALDRNCYNGNVYYNRATETDQDKLL